MKLSFFNAVLFAILTTGCGSSLMAATATWLGTAPGANSTRWGRSDNWSNGAVPTSADNVIFNNTGDYGSSVELRANQAANELTFNTNACFNLENGSGSGKSLTLKSGNITTSAGNTGNQSLDFSTLVMSSSGSFTFAVNGSGTLGVTARIADKDYTSLNKNGTGTLLLSGDNTYAGQTNVNSGVLRISSGTALGTANFNNTVASGAALEFAGNFTLNETGLTLNGTGIDGNGALRSISGTNAYNGQLALNASGAMVGTENNANLSLGGQINGGTLTKVGSGTLTLTGNQGVNTNFVVNGGTAVLNRTANSNLLGNGATVNSGTLRLAANEQIANFTTVTLAPSGSLDLNGYTETINSLAMTGSAVTTGSGTLTLGAGSSITTSADISSATISGNLALTPYQATLNVADGAAAYDLDISAVISGTSILNKTGVGTVRLNNAANNYTGGTTINAGTVAIAPTSGNVGIATNGTNSYLGRGAITVNTGGTLDIATLAAGADFTGFNRNLAINGGTVRLAPNDEITGIMSGSNTLTFGTAGGLLNLDQKLADSVNLGNVQVNTSSGTPAVVRYSTIANTSGDGGWDSGKRDLNVANNSLTGTGHLQFQLNNGAAVHYEQANFGGTLYYQGPASGNAGTGSTGTNTGRLALDSASTFTVAGGLNFDGIMQVTPYNGARTLDTNITVRSGTTAFQGRGTKASTLDDLTIGATVNGRTLTINDGARAVMDIGFRDSNTHNGGIRLNSTTDIAAGGTLEFKQSYSGNTYDQIDVYGNIIGRGNSSKESTVLLNTPTGALPGTGAGTTFFAPGSKLIVNGSGMGGLRVEGTKARVDGLLTDARLAATTGSGGTLTMSYNDGGSRAIGSAANLTIASAINLGLESSGGTFTLSGNLSNWGGLTVGPATTVAFSSNSVFATDDALTLKAGATLSLAGTIQTFGAVNVIGSSIIDFGGASNLSVSSLSIASGVTLTITGWTQSIDYFYSLLSPSVANLAQITFVGTSFQPGAKWNSLDNPISPVPELGSYGFLMVSGLIGLIGFRRRRCA